MANRRRRDQQEQEEEEQFEERVVRIDRTRKTVKGGRVSSSRVCGVIGDERGRVGLGIGKALNAPEGIHKAFARARENMIRVPLDGYTIPHEVQARVGGAVILLRPASRGTGIVAGGAVRQIIEVSGIRDILTKSLGSGNVMNRAKACFEALKNIRDPKQVAKLRGKSVAEMTGREIVDGYEVEDAHQERQTKQDREAEEVAVAEAGGGLGSTESSQGGQEQ